MSDDRVFFDTNILVYANDLSAGEKRKSARRLITECLRADIGSISSQVLSEFWVTVTQKLAIPLDREIAERQLAFLSAFNVLPIDLGIVLSAVKIQARHTISYWDAQIIAAAAQAGCAVLYTEDLQNGGLYEGVRVKNPFAGSV